MLFDDLEKLMGPSLQGIVVIRTKYQLIPARKLRYFFYEKKNSRVNAASYYGRQKNPYYYLCQDVGNFEDKKKNTHILL